MFLPLNLLYIVLSIIVALAVSLFLYWVGKKPQKSPLLAALRFISTLALLWVLWNPKWEREVSFVEKPQLYVAMDNSKSIQYLNQPETLLNLQKKLRESAALQKKFNLRFLRFGKEVNDLDSLSFNDAQTGISGCLQQINSLDNTTNSPVILITDGNQTFGKDLRFLSYHKPVYPVVTGDTMHYEDLQITRINTNPYAFLNNNFPVEIFMLYKGKRNRDARLQIYKGKHLVQSKMIRFSKDKKAQNILLKLPADKVGQSYYSVLLSSDIPEKNRQNNRANFSIEVLNQQSDILLLSSFLHPDLGALKQSIESNKQRKVHIKIKPEATLDLQKYASVILYQPDAGFAPLIKKIQAQKKPVIYITGAHTDWHFLNKIQTGFSKEITTQTEDFQGVYNAAFSGYVTEDIGFESFPPLVDFFGENHMHVPVQTLLFQKINNITREEPLIATYTVDAVHQAVIFGENIWKWRMQYALTQKSFEKFDAFIDALVQFTLSNDTFNRLDARYKKICYSNDTQVIKASLVDVNHQIDTHARLQLILTKKDGKQAEKYAFYRNDNHYEVALSGLKPGDYSFAIQVEDDKQTRFYGGFKVLNYNIEQQFYTANKDALAVLAGNTGGELFFPEEIDTLINTLIENSKYNYFKISNKIFKALIDWRWLLGFIILSLSVEWFIRKYRGLI